MDFVNRIIHQLKYWLPFTPIENVVKEAESLENRPLIGPSTFGMPSTLSLLTPYGATRSFDLPPERVDLPPERPEDDTTPTDQVIEGYRSRKIFAESMINISLFWRNAKQLRRIVEQGTVSTTMNNISAAFVVTSLILQICIGILLATSAPCSLTCKNEQYRKRCRTYGDLIATGILLVSALNILIDAFQDDPS